MNLCKHCTDSDLVNDTTIEHSIHEQLSLEPILVPSYILKERLKICHSCPFLIQHTCSQCGCYIKFRASIPNKQCPLSNW